MIPLREIKGIPIESILASREITPCSRRPGYLTYHSPFREDRHPSFAVDTVKNRWHDFALGLDGSNIDLVIGLGLAASCGEAVRYLTEHFLGESAGDAEKEQPREPPPRCVVAAFTPLRSPPLTRYITRTRGIPAEIAGRYLMEVHCRLPSGKEVYGVGMKNRSGGYAVRNQYFKMAVPPTDITVISGKRHDECLVFEGMLSFLSYVALYGDPEGDVVILNSVTNAGRAAETLSGYSVIHCFLDNDEAGRKAFEAVRASCGKAQAVIDESGRYADYNDLNDILVGEQEKNN